MAGEEGFLYEQKLYKKLKRLNLVPSHFQPAGANNVAPDLIVLRKGKEYKVELKLDRNVDFGQGTLEYDINAKKWTIAKGNTEASRSMYEFLKRVGADTLANQAWGKHGAPMKSIVDYKKFTQKHVDHDYKHFTDQKILVSGFPIDTYYGFKQTYYIQIGGYGFYRLKQDPANTGAPHFNPVLQVRLRIKRGGSLPIYNYRFTTAIQIKNVPAKSPLDLDEDPSFLLM